MNFFDVYPRVLRREIPKKIEYDKAENRPNAQQMKINQTLMESHSPSLDFNWNFFTGALIKILPSHNSSQNSWTRRKKAVETEVFTVGTFC